MNESWIQHFQSLLEVVFSAKYGTTPFWVVAGIAGGSLLIFGWLIANFVFQAKRGIIVCLIAQLLPALAAAAAWIAVTLYAVPEVQSGAVRDYLPLAGAIVGAFLVSLLLTRYILGVSEGAAVFSVILSYGIVAIAVFLGSSLVTGLDEGINSLEEQKEQHRQETDSIIAY